MYENRIAKLQRRSADLARSRAPAQNRDAVQAADDRLVSLALPHSRMFEQVFGDRIQLLAATVRSTQGDTALSTIGRQQLPDDISSVAFGTCKDGWAQARWGVSSPRPVGPDCVLLSTGPVADARTSSFGGGSCGCGRSRTHPLLLAGG
jgi:hypothetical protein